MTARLSSLSEHILLTACACFSVLRLGLQNHWYFSHWIKRRRVREKGFFPSDLSAANRPAQSRRSLRESAG